MFSSFLTYRITNTPFSFPMKWEDSNSQLIQRAYKRRVACNEHENLFI